MFTLRAHSYYSILQGTFSPEDLVSSAVRANSSFACLTDKNGMYGLIEFAKYAKDMNVKPIFGSMIDDPESKDEFAVFLAKNNKGYSELCKIITHRKLREDFKLLDYVKNRSVNIYVYSSSISLLSKLEPANFNKKDFFIELYTTDKFNSKAKRLYEFGKSNGFEFVVTHPTYFLDKEDYLLHKVVSSIRENEAIENIQTDNLVDEEFYLRTSDYFEKTWKALPEAIRNVKEIVKNCNVDLKFGEYKFPIFKDKDNESAFSKLWRISFDGLKDRYKNISKDLIKRLQYELEIIEELGFCDYFLIVWDIVSEAKRRNMMTIGRGSAANSLVAYCLGLTQVDPIEQNFYFERFLNKARTSPPDVDLDFSWKERDEIVRYVFDKYGYDKVAMISTHVTFKARSAFRETAKVFGVSDREISQISKYIPWTSAKNLRVLSEKFPESKNIQLNKSPWIEIIEIATKLSGFPRHLSIHPSGLVITEEPINNYVALEYAKNKGLGLIVTQPDMYSIEDFGLVKIDLLSQRSLGVLRDTMEKLRENKEEKQVKIHNIFDITK